MSRNKSTSYVTMKRYCREYPEPGDYEVADGSRSILHVFDEDDFRLWHRVLNNGQEFIGGIKLSCLGNTPLVLHRFEEVNRRVQNEANAPKRFGAPAIRHPVPGEPSGFAYEFNQHFGSRADYEAYLAANDRVEMSGREFAQETNKLKVEAQSDPRTARMLEVPHNRGERIVLADGNPAKISVQPLTANVVGGIPTQIVRSTYQGEEMEYYK